MQVRTRKKTHHSYFWEEEIFFWRDLNGSMAHVLADIAKILGVYGVILEGLEVFSYF